MPFICLTFPETVCQCHLSEDSIIQLGKLPLGVFSVLPSILKTSLHILYFPFPSRLQVLERNTLGFIFRHSEHHNDWKCHSSSYALWYDLVTVVGVTDLCQTDSVGWDNRRESTLELWALAEEKYQRWPAGCWQCARGHPGEGYRPSETTHSGNMLNNGKDLKTKKKIKNNIWKMDILFKPPVIMADTWCWTIKSYYNLYRFFFFICYGN